jgi:hypothetical protein
VDVHNEASTVTIDMPNALNLFPTFHTSNLKPWLPNDDSKYPSRTLEQPGPIDVDGVEEFEVDSIIDHQKIGRGYRYLVHFSGYVPKVTAGSPDENLTTTRHLINIGKSIPKFSLQPTNPQIPRNTLIRTTPLPSTTHWHNTGTSISLISPISFI